MLKPLHDYVLVSKDKEVEKKIGLIVAPTTVDDKFLSGTILSVGTGKLDSEGKLLDWLVKVGDRVLFSKSSAVELKDDDGTPVYIIREDALLCLSA